MDYTSDDLDRRPDFRYPVDWRDDSYDDEYIPHDNQYYSYTYTCEYIYLYENAKVEFIKRYLVILFNHLAQLGLLKRMGLYFLLFLTSKM